MLDEKKHCYSHQAQVYYSLNSCYFLLLLLLLGAIFPLLLFKLRLCYSMLDWKLFEFFFSQKMLNNWSLEFFLLSLDMLWFIGILCFKYLNFWTAILLEWYDNPWHKVTYLSCFLQPVLFWIVQRFQTLICLTWGRLGPVKTAKMSPPKVGAVLFFLFVK